MSQNNINTALSGKLILDKGEWFYITSAPFCSTIANENISWESIDPNIAQINPNSGLIYAKNIGETSIIGISPDENVRVLCTIQVRLLETTVTTNAIDTPRTIASPACTGSCSNDVSALGYSGTVFSYTELGTRVTLEKGIRAKNGTSNITSYLFRSSLVQMNNIYASMSQTQREVWLTLRLRGILSTILNLLTNSYEELAKSYIRDIILEKALNLGEVEATVNGFRSWYIAEENASAHFNEFQKTF